ncbi:MAG: single-stranded-DNA-specific exonuclease RecJ [Saprospiraceae bacterium]
MRKRWTLLPADEAAVNHLQEVLHINPVLCRLLVQRGITTFDQAKTFFRPDLTQLHDPFLMEDMDKAVERIERAISQKEKILLYGDYDVDGTTCVALLYSFLAAHYDRLDFYIPNRYSEGYGVSRQGVDYAAANDCSLVIAMDCGIRAVEKVAYANSLGIDFIICDHHLPGPELPKAVAILDPMRPDCLYPYKGLSGCGVVFKLAQAFTQKNDLPEAGLFDLLDILVLSIAADIVPMTGENRTLAFFGLERLSETGRLGLQALIEKSRRSKPLAISDIVFGLAPMINAAGRLDDAKLAVKLLLTTDETEAAKFARLLHHQNELRKEHDLHILREAKKKFEEMPAYQERKSILLFDEHWHKGVVGIAAARMVEHYHRPTILLTQSNGMATGSARSVAGFSIYDAIKECSDLLTNFGGHDHAAGMTLPIENVPSFQERFEKIVGEQIDEEMLVPELKLSAVLALKDIDFKFWNILRQFAPFGPGNRSPVFATKNVFDSGHSRLLKGDHVRVAVKQNDSVPVQGIAFGMGEHFSKIKSKKPFHIAYKIEEEKWQDERTLSLVVRDLKF